MSITKKISFSGIPILAAALLLPPLRAQQTPTPAKSQDAVSEKPNAKGFASPEAAVAALCNALRKNDSTDLVVILGPNSRDLVHWTEDDNDGMDEQRMTFVHNFDLMHRLVKEPDNTVALYVGPENWPLPIPIVQFKGTWYFDADLGKQEVVYRRVGRNEMAALDVSRVLIDAEKEYHDDAHRFTDKFESSPSARDGLHWKSADSNARSPIGPYLAQAGVTDSVQNHRPFHGYFYRILLEAPVAPDSDATRSTANHFAIVAFPADYRSSGVMTFILQENGQAYQKDLGPTSASSALQITAANPDNSWTKVD
jgi:Protein of unknown function (DUF2950)